MTTDPDLDLDPLEEVVATRLRRTLAAVAATTPSVDRSAALLDGLDGAAATDASEAAVRIRLDDPDARGSGEAEDVPVVPLATARRRRPSWLAAAAVLVVGAVAVAVLLSSGSEEDPEVRATPGPVGTGWYLPPDGWEITSIDTDYLDVDDTVTCPCTYLAAGRAGRPGVMAITLDMAEVRAAAEPLPGGLTRAGSLTIDVGGRQGYQSPPGYSIHSSIAVPFGGGTLVATVTETGIDVAVAVMDAWLDRREAGEEVDPDDLPWPEEWVHSGAVTPAVVRANHLLAVHARERATGRTVEYQLVPTGFNRSWLWRPDRVGQDGDALRVIYADISDGDDPGQGLPGEPGPQAAGAVIGGPVDIVVGDSFFGESLDALDEAEVGAFLDGMREVGTDEWRAALAPAGSEVDPDVLAAPTLFSAPLTQP